MADLEAQRRKNRERQRRFAERQAGSGQARVTVTLPADLLAQLDTLAAALTISRNDAFVDAVRCWVRPAVPERQPEP